jgi:hypothetical protein
VVDIMSPCIDTEEHAAVSIDVKHHPAGGTYKRPTNTTTVAVNSLQLPAGPVRRRWTNLDPIVDCASLRQGHANARMIMAIGLSERWQDRFEEDL